MSGETHAVVMAGFSPSLRETLAEAEQFTSALNGTLFWPRFWWDLPHVEPGKASILLSGVDPHLHPDFPVPAPPRSIGVVGYRRLREVFEQVAVDGKSRSLAQWMDVAATYKLEIVGGLRKWWNVVNESRAAETGADAGTDMQRPPPAPVAEVQGSTTDQAIVVWTTRAVDRGDELRRALQKSLADADKTKPPPTARDMVQAWMQVKPLGILRVHDHGVDYVSGNPDGERSANLEQIGDRIKGLVQYLASDRK